MPCSGGYRLGGESWGLWTIPFLAAKGIEAAVTCDKMLLAKRALRMITRVKVNILKPGAQYIVILR